MGSEEEQGLDEMLQVKKKIKEMEVEHRKMVDITLTLEAMLESTKEYYYSNTVIYFLTHTLSTLVSRNQAKLQHYLQDNQDFLARNETEAKALHKLQVVFNNEATALTARTNSIKVSLMQCPTLNREVFKFPAKGVLRRHLKEYVEKFEGSSKGASQLNGEGEREDTAFLLRVVWSVAQVEGKELEEGLSLKPEMGKFELAVQLNKFLVALGV
jgi:hypothetical protein